MAMLTKIMGFMACRRLFVVTRTMMIEGRDRIKKQANKIPIKGPNIPATQEKANTRIKKR